MDLVEWMKREEREGKVGAHTMAANIKSIITTHKGKAAM
jgi:hypothetical protein